MEKTGTTNQYRKELKPKILEYAMSQFMIHGIKAVKMDTLAKELGISKRTMYELYENKEALLLEGMKALQQLLDEKLRLVATREDTTVIDILVEFFRIQMLHASKFNPVVFEEVNKYEKLQEYLRDDRMRMCEKAVHFFNRGIEQGYFRDDMDYGLVIRIFAGSTDFIMMNHLYKEYDMKTITRNILSLYLRAFCTLKGVEKLDAMLKE